MHAIDVRDLKKTYAGGVQALKGLSFSVRPGEIFGLLGPNGAGKSTTVRIIVTLSSATSGRVEVDGVDVSADPQEVRRRIGYVNQNTTVDFLATGRENLRLQGQLYGHRGAELDQRVDELLKLFDLDSASKRVTQTYSGGMKRRLDVAMGLVHRPKILVLDEPTTGLDPESRAVMWRELERLAKEHGMTILVTTHYLEEADRLCDRLAIVDGGLIVAEGTPRELKGTLRGDMVQVEIATGHNADSAAELLRGTAGVSNVILEGQTCSAQAEEGARIIPALISALEAAGLPVSHVSMSRPSLDEVYLSVTGKSFEKADQAGGKPAGTPHAPVPAAMRSTK
jgi:ABC-2 type transport system ATP-binding protein